MSGAARVVTVLLPTRAYLCNGCLPGLLVGPSCSLVQGVDNVQGRVLLSGRVLVSDSTNFVTLQGHPPVPAPPSEEGPYG